MAKGGFTQTLEIGRQIIKYAQITGISSSTPIPGGGGAAMIQAEAQNIRYRLDGEDPTSTVGTILAAGDSFWYVGDLSKVRVIEVASGAIVNVHVFR